MILPSKEPLLNVDALPQSDSLLDEYYNHQVLPILDDLSIIAHGVVSKVVQVEDSLIPRTDPPDSVGIAMITAAPVPHWLAPRCAFIDCVESVTAVTSIANTAHSSINSLANSAASDVTSAYHEATSKIVSVYAAATSWWNSHKLNVPDRISYFPMDSCSGSDDVEDNSKFDPEKTYCTTPKPISIASLSLSPSSSRALLILDIGQIKFLDQIAEVCSNLGPILGAAGGVLEVMSWAVMILINFHFIGLVSGAGIAFFIMVFTIAFLILECKRRSKNLKWREQDAAFQDYVQYDSMIEARKGSQKISMDEKRGNSRRNHRRTFLSEDDPLDVPREDMAWTWTKDDRNKERKRVRLMKKDAKMRRKEEMYEQTRQMVPHPGLSEVTWSISTVSLWVLTYTTTFYTVLIMIMYVAAFALAGLVGIKTDLGVLFLIISWLQVLLIFLVTCFWARRMRKGIWRSICRPIKVVAWVCTLGVCFRWCWMHGGWGRTKNRMRRCYVSWKRCRCCNRSSRQDFTRSCKHRFRIFRDCWYEIRGKEPPSEDYALYEWRKGKRQDDGPRKEAIELTEDNLQKLDPTYQPRRNTGMNASIDAEMAILPTSRQHSNDQIITVPPRASPRQRTGTSQRRQGSVPPPRILPEESDYLESPMSLRDSPSPISVTGYDMDRAEHEGYVGYGRPLDGSHPDGPYNASPRVPPRNRPFVQGPDRSYEVQDADSEADSLIGFDGESLRDSQRNSPLPSPPQSEYWDSEGELRRYSDLESDYEADFEPAQRELRPGPKSTYRPQQYQGEEESEYLVQRRREVAEERRRQEYLWASDQEEAEELDDVAYEKYHERRAGMKELARRFPKSEK